MNEKALEYLQQGNVTSIEYTVGHTGIAFNIQGVINKEPIYELNENKMEKIASQSQAMNVIRARMYVVASVDENGYFSMAASPVPHATAAIAKSESRRLAKLSPGKVYVAMQLVGGEMLPKAVNFVSV